MTTIYFVRHARPDFSVHDDAARPLSEKGMKDCAYIRQFFSNVHVDAFYSSPYERALKTIEGAAKDKNMPITIDAGFRERAVSEKWIDDFDSFARRQWAEFDFRLPGGESLTDTETRSVLSLRRILHVHPDQTIVIGGHGTAISCVIHHFRPSFSYHDFKALQEKMPFILKMTFEKDHLTGIHLSDVCT